MMTPQRRRHGFSDSRIADPSRASQENDAEMACGLFRKILLPLGMSAENECLLPQAIYLSAIWHSEVVILHLCQRNSIRSSSRLVQSNEPDYDRIRDRLLEAGAPAVRIITSDEDPTQAIEVAAQCHDASLLLLPSECDANSPPPWFGTTVQRLLRRAPAPLLIMKGGITLNFQSLLCAVEPSDSAESALKHAVELARSLQTHLTILRVIPDSNTIPVVDRPVWSTTFPTTPIPDARLSSQPGTPCFLEELPGETEQNHRLIQAREELALLLEQCDISDVDCDLRIVSGTAAAQILLMARTLKSGLILTGGRIRAGQMNIAHRSLAETIMEMSSIPIIAFPDTKIHYAHL